MTVGSAVSTLLLNPWTLALAVVAITFRIYNKATMGMCTCTRRLDGLTALVTGANTGIGLETARDLARRGARVLLACRDPQRGQQALESVRAVATGRATVELLSLDLASLDSVRACAAKIVATEHKVDILINNAGAVGLGNVLSRDGLHCGLQVNYFGPFLFTLLLENMLKKCGFARVVFVSSALHSFATLKPEMLDHKHARNLNDSQIYMLSKLLNVINANELARRLKGTGVTVNSLHPGVVLTDINRRRPQWFQQTFNFIARLFFKTAVEGAQTTIHVAVSQDLEGVTGRYFSDCKEARMSSQAYDEALARAIWKRSEELVKLSDEERPSFAS